MVIIMKIKDMQITEMPREKLMLYGVENLSNSELISIILRTGTKDNNACDIANNILNSLGGINALTNVGIRELSKIKGVGSVKAVTLLAAIELGKRINNQEIKLRMDLRNSLLIHNSFKKEFKGLKQEKFLAIYLDHHKRLISYKTLSLGTIDKTIVHPREIFNKALRDSASSIVVMHNHPSGMIEPSKEDIEITNKIIESGKMLSIPLLDHIITNGDDYYSFFEKNIM